MNRVRFLCAPWTVTFVSPELAVNFCQPGSIYHSNIKVLDLSHNNVSRIDGGFFKPAELSLTQLYLAHNAITVSYLEMLGTLIANLELLFEKGHSALYRFKFNSADIQRFIIVYSVQQLFGTFGISTIRWIFSLQI